MHNANICTLVGSPMVKYDPHYKTCTIANIHNDGCQTPGLNKLACLNLASERCYWDAVFRTCNLYVNSQTAPKCEEI